MFKKKYLFLISELFNVYNSMSQEESMANGSLLFCQYKRSSVHQGVIFFCPKTFTSKEDIDEYFNRLVDNLSKEKNVIIFVINNNILAKYPDEIIKILNTSQKPWILLNNKEVKPVFGETEHILEIKAKSPNYIKKITDKQYNFSPQYLEKIINYVENNCTGLSDEIKKDIIDVVKKSILYIISQKDNQLNKNINYCFEIYINGKNVFLEKFHIPVDASIYKVKDKEIISLPNEIPHTENEIVKFNIFFEIKES